MQYWHADSGQVAQDGQLLAAAVIDAKAAQDGPAFYDHSRVAGVDGFGQILVTAANPGQIKGNHYHKRKVEWFCVIEGDMEVHLLDVESKEKKVVEMGESNPRLLKINPGVSHAIKNSGDKPAVLLIYISESYDPEDADTFVEEVLPIPEN